MFYDINFIFETFHNVIFNLISKYFNLRISFNVILTSFFFFFFVGSRRCIKKFGFNQEYVVRYGRYRTADGYNRSPVSPRALQFQSFAFAYSKFGQDRFRGNPQIERIYYY